MNTDGHLYSENEIAGNMMEEYDKKDQQTSVEVNFINNLLIYDGYNVINLLTYKKLDKLNYNYIISYL